MRILNYLIVFLVAVILSSCSQTESIVPQYTTVTKLTSVNPGMTKAQVLNTLGVYPYDILQNQKGGCEIHEYKYKHLEKILSMKSLDKKEGLTMGAARYKTPETAYIIFRNGKVEAIYSDVSKRDLLTLISHLSVVEEACGNIDYGLKKGCTDPESYMYDPEAIVDDNTCKYCDCGYYKNPEYDFLRPKKDCAPCLKNKEPEKPCTECDLIDKLKQSDEKINLNINMNGGRTGNSSQLFLNNTQLKTNKARAVKKTPSNLELAKQMAPPVNTKEEAPVQNLKSHYTQLEQMFQLGNVGTSLNPRFIYDFGLMLSFIEGNKTKIMQGGFGVGLLYVTSDVDYYYSGNSYYEEPFNSGIVIPIYAEPKLNITRSASFSLQLAGRVGINLKLGDLTKYSLMRNDLKLMFGFQSKKSFAFHYFVGPTKIGEGFYDGMCAGLSFAW